MDLYGVYISIRLGDKKEKNDSNENENKQTTIGNANVTYITDYVNNSNNNYTKRKSNDRRVKRSRWR